MLTTVDCPRCNEPLTGRTIPENEPCADCAAGRVSCHSCGWEPRIDQINYRAVIKLAQEGR